MTSLGTNMDLSIEAFQNCLNEFISVKHEPLIAIVPLINSPNLEKYRKNVFGVRAYNKVLVDLIN